ILVGKQRCRNHQESKNPEQAETSRHKPSQRNIEDAVKVIKNPISRNIGASPTALFTTGAMAAQVIGCSTQYTRQPAYALADIFFLHASVTQHPSRPPWPFQKIA